jgi:hypothetical protein
VAGAVVLALTVTLGVAWPAAAHPADGTQSDAEHAAQDLAGTPITEIERETKVNATRIARATGTVPGRRSTATTNTQVERRASAVALDPGVGGSWSSVVPTQVVPVFQAVLPNGKVLIWDSVGDGAAESYPDQTFTRAMVWNPADNTSKRVDVVGYNIFCAGYTQLGNGNVFVAGGNKNQALDGIVQTHIFDWKTETWSRGPDMASGRWYPSVAPLANGEAYISGGGPTTAEVYQTDNTLRRLLGFADPVERWYPFLVTRPDGQVQWAGPKNAMRTIDTSGNGAVTAARTRDGKQRDYGSFATYAIGKTLVAGGGNFTEDGQTTVPTKTAVVVDTNSGTTVTATGSMAQGRRQYDLTVLADGTVLATGGMSKVGDSDLVNLTNPTFAAERWNPATGTWTTLAPASRVRQYHSTAALLPDGRVMTGGGGVCGVCTAKGYLEKNVEYFTPPYLYKNDGSGQLATRPVISTAPTQVSLNSSFAIGTAQAASIKKVALIRLGAPTHGDDQGQRYVPLTYTVSGSTLTAAAPANGAIAPPGYYYLVVTDAAGVPSVAKIVKVAQGSNPVATSIRGVGSTKCIDIDGARAVNKARLQLYTCNSTPAQMWTPTTDGTLQALGKCMDVDGGRRVVGGPVQIYTCNGTTAQRWTRGADQTIRPTASPTLCLGAVGSGTANKTLLELQTCTPASTAQKWTW